MSDESGPAESTGRDDCPTADMLAAWDGGRLTTEETERIAEHLLRCPRCEAVNATATADEQLISWTLMQSPASALDEPDLAQALSALLEQPEDFDPAQLPDEALRFDAPPGDDRFTFPERIGSYALVRPLGRGAMGWVFEAEHVNLRRRVALKLLSPTARLDAAHVTRFYEEMAAVGKLSHPHIVQAFDAGEADGHHYLAMELVAGCDASKLVKRLGALGVADACDLARQVAAALQYAHAHGMAHRDVKPSNVMVSPQGQVKLLDLGLATIRDVAASEFAVAGTAEYMAPERWDSRDAAGAPADLYALGCTLFKLLTGSTPYAGAATSTSELAEAHRRGAIPSLRALRDNVPAELDALVARLLAKRPEARPSAEQVQTTLKGFREGADLRSLVARAILVDSDADTLPPSRTWTSMPAPPRKRRLNARRLVALAVTLLALTAAAAWTYRYFDQGEVEIVVEPPGATIAIDGGARQLDIPGDRMVISLASGKHMLVASKSGFQERSQEIVVARGERLGIRIPLEAEPLIIEEADQWLAHEEGVRKLAVSPDGVYAATIGNASVLRLWKIESHELVREFVVSKNLVHVLAFSPDGTRILSGGDDRIAHIWDVETGRELRSFAGHAGAVLGGAFSHDGTRIATGSEDATVRVWDIETTDCLWLGAAHYIWVRTVDFLSDDRLLLTGGNDTLSIVWDARTGSMRRALVGQSSVVLSGEFSADGARVLTGGYDRQALLWDVEREERMRAYVGHAEGLIATFTPDERYVVTASADRELRYWSVEHDTCLARFVGHQSGVTGVQCLADGDRLISSSGDGTVRVWQLPRTSDLPAVPSEPPATRIPAPDPPEDVVLVSPRRQWVASDRAIHAIAISHDGSKLATAGEDRLAQVWEIERGALARQFAGSEDHLLSVAFSADGRLLAAAGKDRVVRTYDVSQGTLTHAYHGHRNWVTSLSFMSGGPWLLTAGVDGTLRTWNTLDHQPLNVLSQGREWVRAAAFSPNQGSSYAISAGHDVRLTRWEIGSGVATANWQPGRLNILSCAAYSPDGRLAAVAGWSSSFDVWDLVDGRHLASVSGHSGAVQGVAFLPDNERLVTSGEDFSVRVWHVGQAREVARLTGPTTSVRAVAVSRDGSYIAAAALDGRVFIWPAPAESQARSTP